MIQVISDITNQCYNLLFTFGNVKGEEQITLPLSNGSDY